MIKNSIRQLFRTRLRTILFFILIAMCDMLICLGCNLVKQSNDNMEKFKDVFMTIGTVEQTPIAYSVVANYDAALGGYTYYNQKQYGKIFSVSELDMEGVEYISGPERRAGYYVYMPEFEMHDKNVGSGNIIIVEASPQRDGIPAGPIPMVIKKVLFDKYKVNFQEFFFCDHYNDSPQMMYADKTYIMCIMDRAPHGYFMGNPEGNPFEYRPFVAPFTGQTTADGTPIPSVMPELSVEELNDAFYEQGHDLYWESFAQELEYSLNKIPVTATDDLNLIMAFYDNEVNMLDGAILDDTDFAEGNNVCLISGQFARRNLVKVGDTVTLPLRVANYADPPIYGIEYDPLRADGTNFEPFFTADYIVKGIYQESPGGGMDEGYRFDKNEIFIPKKSIKADDSDNIGIYGTHISPYNTSFRIPNGTIDEFLAEWEKKGIDDVTIHFYDRGYSKLEAGMHQMERMAVYLLAAGVVMTVLVLLFFCSMMIGGQKKRTAIERSLGSDKVSCLKSLLAGIILVAAAGCIIGSLFGAVMTKGIATLLTEKQVFDRTYSAGVVTSDIEEVAANADWVVTVLAFAGVLGSAIIISICFAYRNLKEEPLMLLSGNSSRE